jgi:hypothetical protein
MPALIRQSIWRDRGGRRGADLSTLEDPEDGDRVLVIIGATKRLVSLVPARDDRPTMG